MTSEISSKGPKVLQELPVEQVVEDLIRASRIFVAIAANSVAGDDEQLSLQQYRALALLASREGQRPADLARSLGVTPSTTTALCDRLVQKGMISRRRRGSDRRSVYLVVSARGHEQLEKVSARRGHLLREIFVRLPSRTQAQLAEVLPTFIEAAGHVDVDEWSIKGLVASRATAADWVQ
jgi:DNA-binding MarR family transcriptional regulator